MLSKFETKSARVKGLAFHCKRPWILASLHSGAIQLWNYHDRTMIDKFEEHEGPVRGIDFHKQQPLFVSGGDDHKIKVWNYKTRRCIFTLTGHNDYVRSTFFHHEYPWILSTSDDTTIRIWNWQSRTCICVLTGHNHYVMCAQFHPSKDLIVSAAIDQTLRVWDVSGLRDKNVAPRMGGRNDFATSGSLLSSSNYNSSPFGSSSSNSAPHPDLFGRADAIVRNVCEGHNSEVNWACFHPDPNTPLLLSGADDHYVKLWRMDESRVWEIDTCKGHYNNVTCTIFHPRKDLILSVSEDKSIRVWDLSKRTAINSHRRETDRFWIIVAHPKQNLFAAGHDSGLLLFKLERERPPFVVHEDIIYYVKDNYLRKLDISQKSDFAILRLRGRGEIGHPIHNLHFNPYTKSILLSTRSTTNVEKSTYDLYTLPNDKTRADHDSRAADSRRGQGLTAVFVGRDRFAVLDKSRKLVIKNMQNEDTKLKTTVNCDEIFYAGPGRLFLKDGDSLILFDVQQGVSKATVKARAKLVVRNKDSSLIAVICTNQIIICDRDLKVLSTVNENAKIKSAAWDENGVLIYTTPVHVKYALVNGDFSTIRTIDTTVYIVSVRDNVVYCLDRNCDIKRMQFDPTEYKFKQALVNRDYEGILQIIRKSKLVGQAAISYLQKKGYPEIALHFVKDQKTRFSLALDCGNIEEALLSAQSLDERVCWQLLADAALMAGNMKVVEIAYQRTKNLGSLAMLYLVTGNKEKLEEVAKMAQECRDTSVEYELALVLQDYHRCARIFSECDQLTLAYHCSVKHGSIDLVDQVAEELTPDQVSKLGAANLSVSNSVDLNNLPRPVTRCQDNWPLLNVSRGFFDAALNANKELITTNVDGGDEDFDEEANAEEGAWGDDDDFDDAPESIPSKKNSKKPQEVIDDLGQDSEDGDENEGWGLDDGMDGLLSDLESDEEGAGSANDTTNRIYFTPPTIGRKRTDQWISSSNAASHVLAGNFEGAFLALRDQIGLVDASKLKPIFLELFQKSRFAYRGLSPYPSSYAYASRNWDNPEMQNSSEFVGEPSGYYTLDDLQTRLKDCYALTTAGKFPEAIDKFRALMYRVLFMFCENGKEVEQSKDLLDLCKEYIVGLLLEEERKLIGVDGASFEDQKRSCEMAAYMTHLKMTKHKILVFRKALSVFRKSKEFLKTKAAASIARRLLEYAPPQPDLVSFAKKVVQSYDVSSDQQMKLDYDELNPFSVCASTFKPIYRGRPEVKCPFCQASYSPQFKNTKCRVCLVSLIGLSSSGLSISAV